MTRMFSPGFLTPAAGRISLTETAVFSRDVLQTDRNVVDWDYSAKVTVQVDLQVDFDGVRADIGVDGDLRLAAALHWTASGTGLRGAGPPVDVTSGPNTLRLELDGSKLGGVLTLSPRVVFKAAERRTPLSPQRAGSTLWSDQFSVVLEGGGVRFPTMPVPFSQSGIAGGGSGAWALDVRGPDMNVSASSAISLYLNSEHPKIAEMLADQTAQDAGLILRFIEYDVTRQLMSFALAATELDDSEAQEPGTLGEALINVLRRLFPGRSLTELRGAMKMAPGEMEAELQSVLDLPIPVKR